MNKILVLIFLILFQIKTMAQEKNTLIYFGDPMCSWCYGFSPEFSKVTAAMDGNINVELVMGGLRPYNTETMTDLGGFLKHHWEEVGSRSGQPFQYDILNASDIIYDTEPACRAVVAVRQMDASLAFAFFKAVQHAFYFENKNLNLTSTFTAVAEQFNLDKKEFQQLFESEALKKAVQEDFARSAEMGVRGFPTVIFKKGEDYYLLSNGYTKAEEIIAKINQVKSN
jgi:putative protein-disulfide isomerase